MKQTSPPIRYALLSVYDKSGIVDLARFLSKNGFLIISTGGTAKVLQEKGVKVLPIEKVSGTPEVFDGRVKTLTFKIQSGILFDRTNASHRKEAKKLAIPNIDLVVCNLYPFSEVIKNKKASLPEVIEMIDIGGPTMVRGAAKNYQSVAIVVDPKDYDLVKDQFKKKDKLSIEFKAMLAVKAFKVVADYDSIIASDLSLRIGQKLDKRLALLDGQKLRYGENPHQQGFFYKTESDDKLSLVGLDKLQGKEISFNNFLDVDAAIYTLASIENGKPTCVIIKHGNPCGAARARSAQNAFVKALASDPLAAFGGIIALNRPIDKKLANTIVKDKKFFEIIIAPQVLPTAREVFVQKKDLRVLISKNLTKPTECFELDYKKVRGGFLVQDPDNLKPKVKDLKMVTRVQPTKKQIKEMLFAWDICRICKSNSIVISKGQSLMAAGVGQQDRKRCCELAVEKGAERVKGSVAASDGFFPFADGPQVLVKAGVKAIIQPGGSINDDEVIEFCNKNKIPMVFTQIRCFKH